MTNIRNLLIAVLAFTVAAALIVASAFAADGDNGNSKRRGDNGKLKTGTFQIVVPKADRGGAGRQVAKFLPPKSERTGSGPITAQFVAPKADRGNSSGSSTPTTLFSVSPKAPRAGDGPLAGDGPVTAKFVAPKAPRGNGPVLARVGSRNLPLPSCSRRLLTQPPSTSSSQPPLPLPSRQRHRPPWSRARVRHRPRPSSTPATAKSSLPMCAPPSITATVTMPAPMLIMTNAMTRAIPAARTETMAATEFVAGA
jgi:hypothetical protein